jgi:hypothetical protein
MTLLSSAPTAQAGARPGRLAVPWTTILTLAVLLDFADGFFMTSLRNAVSAMRCTRQPFTCKEIPSSGMQGPGENATSKRLRAELELERTALEEIAQRDRRRRE